jgi:hypothetical protein
MTKLFSRFNSPRKKKVQKARKPITHHTHAFEYHEKKKGKIIYQIIGKILFFIAIIFIQQLERKKKFRQIGKFLYLMG